MKRKINVGLIGHKFMGKAHSHALRDLSMFFDLDVEPVMKVLCGKEEDVKDFAAKYGWESFGNSWESVVENPEIDAISIAAPGVLHRDIAVAAAKHGKHILCEKPLANTLEESKEMYEAAKAAGVIHMTNFNYRRVPAVSLAKELLSQGRLGRIYHFRAIYQQDWAADEAAPYVWRFDKKMAGAGSMADKGAHIIDLARYLIGEITEVVSTNDIFIKERGSLASTQVMETVTTDDSAIFITRFDNGATGAFETSRISAGHKNGLSFEVNGSGGSLRFNLERLNELEVYLVDEAKDIPGFRNILVTEPGHPYIKSWWPSGHLIGWEHTFIHQYYEFFKAISENRLPSPNFYDGVKAQEIIEAAMKSAEERRWVNL